MIRNFINVFNKTMYLQPVPYELSDVTDAWSKVDRILTDAYMDSHVDTAERLLNRIIKNFELTESQINSPLIAGMYHKIWSTREKLTEQESTFVTGRT